MNKENLENLMNKENLDPVNDIGKSSLSAARC